MRQFWQFQKQLDQILDMIQQLMKTVFEDVYLCEKQSLADR